MVLQLLLVAGFVAFIAGAMNSISRLSTKNLAIAGAQWLGVVLIASAAFAAGSHTALLVAGAAGVMWFVWKSAPVALLGAVLGVLLGAVNAPQLDVLGTGFTAGGTAVSALGMLLVVVGAGAARNGRRIVVLRSLERVTSTAIGTIRELGLDLPLVTDLKRGFGEFSTRRGRAAAAEEAKPEAAPAADHVVEPVEAGHDEAAHDAVDETVSSPAGKRVRRPGRPRRGEGRTKRQLRDAADEAMLARLAEAAPVADTPVPPPASTPVEPKRDESGDDEAFDAIVKMLRHEG